MRALTGPVCLVALIAVGSVAPALGSPPEPRRRTLGKPFGSHLNEVPRHLAFSRDGAQLVSAGHEFLCVHDARTLERIDVQRHPRGSDGRLLSCRVAAFDLDGRLVVESGDSVRLLELGRTSQPNSVLCDTDGSGLGALSPDGASIVLASSRGVTVGDVRGRRRVTLMTHPEVAEVLGISWSTDGMTVAAILWLADSTGSRELQMHVRAWDARTGVVRFDRPLAGSPPFIVGTARGFAWTDERGLLVVDALGREVARWTSPARASVAAATADGTLLAVALDDGAVHVLERDLTERARLEVPHGVTALAFDRDGRRVAVAEHSNLRVFDLTDENDRRAGPHRAPIDRLALSPDGRRLASLDGGGQLATWDLTTGDSAETITRAVGPGGVGQLGFSPTGELLGTNAHGDSNARLDRWTCDGVQLPALMVRLPTGYDYQVGLAASSARFAAGSTVLHLFDDTGAALGSAPLPDATGVGVTALSRDGALAVVGGLRLCVLDLLGGRPPRELAVAPAFAAAVAITPDGARVAAWLYESQRSRVVVWDVASGRTVADVPDATSVAFSPDGARLAVGLRDAHELRLLDAATGATLQRIVDLPGALAPLAFSADGAWVAWGNSGAVELVPLRPR